MVIDVNNLQTGDTASFSGEEVVSVLDSFGGSAKDVLAKLSGTITRLKSSYLLNAEVLCTIPFSCSKCLEETAYKTMFQIEERFLDSANSENDQFSDDLWLIPENGVINLTDCLVQNLYVNMPMAVTCSDSCQGLCKYCGCNLNKTSCDCLNKQLDDIDPRFSALRSFKESNNDSNI